MVLKRAACEYQSTVRWKSKMNIHGEWAQEYTPIAESIKVDIGSVAIDGFCNRNKITNGSRTSDASIRNVNGPEISI